MSAYKVVGKVIDSFLINIQTSYHSMPTKGDEMQEAIYDLVKTANEPLETEEVIRHIHSNVEKGASRNKVMYRLNNLRAEGKISGKMLGSGKGVLGW